MDDIEEAANIAIRTTILHPDFRPNFSGSWMTAVPNEGQLSFETQEWLGFLTVVLTNYNHSVTPKRTAKRVEFESMDGKQLIALRKSIVAKTV